MEEIKKGKTIRVKASVRIAQTFTKPDPTNTAYGLRYKAGEEIGIATGKVFEYSPVLTFVEVLINRTYEEIDPETDEPLYTVEFEYVDIDDIDILSEDVEVNDGTVVIDESGKEIGTSKDFPNAIKTGKTNTKGKDVYVLVSTGPEAKRPQWLTFGLWGLVVVGVITFGVVLYKSFSK